MDSIFSKTPVGIPLVEFSPLHLTVLALFVSFLIVTIVFKKRIQANPFLCKRLPLYLGFGCWAFELVFHVWSWYWGLDFIETLIPLQLCSISLLMTIWLVLSDSPKVFQFYYFFSWGAVLALLFPSISYSFPHVRFLGYFYCHSYIVWLNVYYLCVRQFKIETTAFRNLVIVMIPLAVAVRWIDLTFHYDYMFLSGPSATESPLNFLGDGMEYFFKLLGLALAGFYLLYLLAPKQRKTGSL